MKHRSMLKGTQQALELPEPASLLVLYRTRIDETGRLALARLDRTLGREVDDAFTD